LRSFGDVFVAGFEVEDNAIISRALAGAKAGELVVINPAPAREIPAEILATQPILVPNELEARALTGETDPIAAAKMLAGRSNAPVVVTLGPRGAVLVDEGRVETVAGAARRRRRYHGRWRHLRGALAAELSIGRSLIEAVRLRHSRGVDVGEGRGRSRGHAHSR
jgi:ribokinase